MRVSLSKAAGLVELTADRDDRSCQCCRRKGGIRGRFESSVVLRGTSFWVLFFRRERQGALEGLGCGVAVGKGPPDSHLAQERAQTRPLFTIVCTAQVGTRTDSHLVSSSKRSVTSKPGDKK